MIAQFSSGLETTYATTFAVLVLLVTGIELARAGIDRRLNQVWNAGPYETSSDALRIHKRLVIADLHADFLLWKRDLLKGHIRGHVDLPRLKLGNVALQVFSVVTQSPWGQNYESNFGDSDRITLLAVAHVWPVRTWFSLSRRALYQARRLEHATRGGSVMIIRKSSDLDRLLERRSSGSRIVGAVLAVEGLHALEGRIENVAAFFEAGFRIMAPVHMFDNELGGSAHGENGSGLTEFGRQVLRRMDELSIVVDLAHASAPLIDDVLRVTSNPVLVSHTGVRATCESPRNLSDDQLRRVAATGGVIGIGFWDRAVCGTTVKDIVRAIRHVADLVGVDHVALGSDFDGTVRTIFDARGLARIMGGNVLRLLGETLPP